MGGAFFIAAVGDSKLFAALLRGSLANGVRRFQTPLITSNKHRFAVSDTAARGGCLTPFAKAHGAEVSDSFRTTTIEKSSNRLACEHET